MAEILRQYPSHSEHTTWQEIGDEVIILDVDSGAYFGLPGPAVRVWQLADGAITVDQIAQRIVDEYDVDLDQARADVGELVDYLIENRLLVCRQSPTEPPPPSS